MRPLQQHLDEIVASLTEMDAEWLDDAASKIIGLLGEMVDQRTIMQMQNRGEIARVYTRAMMAQMEAD